MFINKLFIKGVSRKIWSTEFYDQMRNTNVKLTDRKVLNWLLERNIPSILCSVDRPFITILVNNQHDALSFSLLSFIPVLYMFPATKCSSSGESVVSIRPLLYAALLGC